MSVCVCARLCVYMSMGGEGEEGRLHNSSKESKCVYVIVERRKEKISKRGV